MILGTHARRNEPKKANLNKLNKIQENKWMVGKCKKKKPKLLILNEKR